MMLNYYSIFHPFVQDEYKTKFYIASSLSEDDVNKHLLALQLIHAKLPYKILADDTIDNEHIHACWQLIQPEDKLYLNHDGGFDNAVNIDLHENWESSPIPFSEADNLANELDNKYHLGHLMLEIDRDIFNGKCPHSPFYGNPNKENAKKIDEILASKDVTGMDSIISDQAIVNFK